MDCERLLQERLGRPVRVDFGRARRRPVQAVFGDDALRVRLHGFFREAPEGILEDLASWLSAGRRARAASGRLDAWIDARLAELPPPALRPVRCRPRGHVHDLEALAGPLFASEFVLDYGEGRPRPRLTWGRRGPSCARRSLQLGSYTHRARVVRVHPVLDRREVPGWFVRYILFHEILHDVLPSRERNGRTVHHGRAFRARERAYSDYRRAQRWQARNIGKLIRDARYR